MHYRTITQRNHGCPSSERLHRQPFIQIGFGGIIFGAFAARAMFNFCLIMTIIEFLTDEA